LKIILDPGHGGNDPGALSFEEIPRRESDIAMAFSRRLHQRLQLHPETRAWQYSWTHLGEGKSLPDRVKCANDYGADLFISLHCNAFHSAEASGFEVWTSRGTTKSDAVATAIYEKVGEEFPRWKMRADYTDNDPDKEAGFYVLRKTAMPAVLIELGFITNELDLFLLTNRPTARALTAAVASGIVVAMS
jgi:N-acetylmuramoyl-L-alanine amidase